ncbi:MAG: hypothetical protein JW768_01280 [Chitinispirillaceae bacterium]|nr:hypothetical protein [Chitinispirillaceae bacterium]
MIYLLLGFALLACAFLFMILVHFLSMEKNINELNERIEVHVKNFYSRGDRLA